MTVRRGGRSRKRMRTLLLDTGWQIGCQTVAEPLADWQHERCFSRDPQLSRRRARSGANQPRRRRELLSDAARSSCSAVTTVTGKPSDSTR